MRALVLWVCLVIACNAAGVFVASYLPSQIGTIALLGTFFVSLVVSWIATVFIMDGSLNNFYAEKDQIEAERKGKEYMRRSSSSS
jgi:hypothetical protein